MLTAVLSTSIGAAVGGSVFSNTQTSFTFRASQDGDYAFNLVTVEKTGRTTPQDIHREAPARLIIIDTSLPQVEVRNLGRTPQGQLVQCAVHDANPDPARTRFFFQTPDQIWRLLDPLPDQPDTFLIPIQASTTGKVRLTAVDLAGNSTKEDFHLAALPVVAEVGTAPVQEKPLADRVELVSRKPGPEVGPLVEKFQGPCGDCPRPGLEGRPTCAAPNCLPSSVVVASKPIEPIQAVVVPQPEAVPAPPAITPVAITPVAITHVPPGLVPIPPVPITPPARPLAQELPPPRHTVTTRRIVVDYRIDSKNQVSLVEIWGTPDLGQTWQKLATDTDCHSPAEIELPGAGIFGLSLVVADDRGFSAGPPEAGTRPDWWVEVDLSRPRGHILGIRTAENGPAGVEVPSLPVPIPPQAPWK